VDGKEQKEEEKMLKKHDFHEIFDKILI